MRDMDRTTELRESRALRERRSVSKDPQTQDKPAAMPDKTKKDKDVSGGAWVEPAVSTKASYQDHGGAGYGVVEHMQPLGESPSGKVKARVKSEAPRKSLLGRSAAAAGQDGAQETPEGTPAPPALPSSTAAVAALPPVVIDDERDADYAPAAKKVKKEKKEKKEKTPASARKRTSEPAPPGMTQPKIGRPKGSTNKPATKKRVYDAVKMRRVVEAAKERAVKVGKPDLAEAVHEIWVRSLSDDNLTDLLEAILTQKATVEQTEEFQLYVRDAKQKLKDEKASERKTPASASGSAANGQALPVRSPSKTPAAPVVKPSKPAATYESVNPTYKELSRQHADGGKKIKKESPKKKSSREKSNDSDSSLTELESGDDRMDVDDYIKPANGRGGGSRKPNGLVAARDQAAERSSLAPPARQSVKRSSAEAELDETEQARVLAAKKVKLADSLTRDSAAHTEESNIRDSRRQPPAQPRAARKENSATPALGAQSNGERMTNGRTSRAVSADTGSPLSDLSPPSSRMSTPQHMPRGPARTIGNRGAKTKTSPEKKPMGEYGGLSTGGGARAESPGADDDNDEESDNNDFCSACGSSGYLLCCDGCDKSFHFKCLDPPISEDAHELNEPWYCVSCVARQPTAGQPERARRGLFGPLFKNLDKRNPSNFQLPLEVRDHFVGVSTGKFGEFVEAVNAKTRSRPGWDDVLPDYYKVKDPKGAIITCYSCKESAIDRRAIIDCDHCSEYWHLDCLDPPLANPPVRNVDGRKTHDWMCPLHADHELRHVDTSLLAPRRTIHLRKPKNAKLVDTALQRGFRNNGLIEIADESSEDEEFREEYGRTRQDHNVIYRLPRKGVKLDFISKIKDARIQEMREEHAARRVHANNAADNTPAPPVASTIGQANFTRRSIADQQLAINLARFASANQDLDLSEDRVENLVGALIAEAPAEVVESMIIDEGTAAKKNDDVDVELPSPPESSEMETAVLSDEQRRELKKLRELINRKLEGGRI